MGPDRRHRKDRTTALAGSAFPVGWTGTISGDDYVTVVPMGSDEGRRGNYFRTRDASERNLRAPSEPGLYELRDVLNEGDRTLAAQPIEVLSEDATLESGARIEAPDRAAPGATIEIGWTVDSTSADQRVTLAQANQAIFTWITAVRLEGDPPVTLTLPEDSGSYELRILDVANQAVLARKVIEVR